MSNNQRWIAPCTVSQFEWQDNGSAKITITTPNPQNPLSFTMDAAESENVFLTFEERFKDQRPVAISADENGSMVMEVYNPLKHSAQLFASLPSDGSELDALVDAVLKD